MDKKQLKKVVQMKQLEEHTAEVRRRSTTCLAGIEFTPRSCETGRLSFPTMKDLTPAARWYAEWRSYRLGGFRTDATDKVRDQREDSFGSVTPQQKIEETYRSLNEERAMEEWDRIC